MKIVLICMGGITTNILAKKMQMYANEHGIAIEVQAVSYSQYEQYLTDTDIILVAPQVNVFYEEIKKNIDINNIKVALLDERDIVQPDFQRLFSSVLSYPHKKRKAEIYDVVEANKKSLVYLFLAICRQSFFACIPMCFLGIPVILIHTYCGNSFFDLFYNSYIPVFCLYTIIVVAYVFGKKTNKNPRNLMILSIACCLMILPVDIDTTYIDGNLVWNTLYLSIKCMDFLFIPLSFIGSFSVAFIYSLFVKLLNKVSTRYRILYLKEKGGRSPFMYIQTLPIVFVFITFLVIRYVILVLLS